ncbi:MAG: MBL fold metallo-hydrolase [Candidatus Paceibacterota bacterium]
MFAYQQKGEQKGIGATMHFIQYGGKNIIVDCGIGFERTGEINNKVIPAGNFLKETRIDLIIITHSHVDHVGAVPRLVAEHPEALVFISDSAYDIAEVMLNDSLKIYKSESRNLQNVSVSGETYEMLFDEKDLDNFLNSDQVVVIPIHRESYCEELGWGWKIGFYSAGHTTGAVMVMFSAPGERPLLVTGDTASHDQEIIPGIMIPPDEFINGLFDNHDAIMIMEGTNGNRMPQFTRKQMKTRLVELVQEVRNRGGITFLPTYAQTKSSNMALALIEAGIIPHIDGLARKLAPLEIPNFQQLVDSGKLVLIEDGEKGDYHRQMLMRGEDPCGHECSPIISPSASLDMGRAVSYAEKILPNPKNALIFTGYMFPGSTAKQILEIERGRTVVLSVFKNGMTQKVPVNVRCDVHHFDFTSHDYSDALVERVRLVQPRDVIIHHCEKASFNALATKIGALDNPPRVHWGRHEKEIRLK